MGLTIRELLSIGEHKLLDAGVESCGIDAETLLGFELGLDKAGLFLNRSCVIDDERSESWFALIGRRAAGEPLQYITGEQYFMGLRFCVDPSVLIPRPETELLASKAIEFLLAEDNGKSVLDLCTGSGALAVSIAKACPRASVTASDISADALACAKQNARALGVADRVNFVKSDLFAAFERGACGGPFDLIVTNPPYIRTGDFTALPSEIREHEPVTALDGGIDGLDFYRRIASGARGCMQPGACLMLEIGADQTEAVTTIFSGAGFASIETFRDLNGLDRMIKTS